MATVMRSFTFWLQNCQAKTPLHIAAHPTMHPTRPTCFLAQHRLRPWHCCCRLSPCCCRASPKLLQIEASCQLYFPVANSQVWKKALCRADKCLSIISMLWWSCRNLAAGCRKGSEKTLQVLFFCRLGSHFSMPESIAPCIEVCMKE